MKSSETTLPDQIDWVETDDRLLLASRLARQVADWLRTALQEQERASLAVSGGKTPLNFFSALSQLDVPWSRVDITLADERWVNSDDEASNERLVRHHLLRHKAQEARFVGLKVDTATPEEGLDLCEQQLETIRWPLDVLVLGMGADGHTASLFPGTAGLEEALTTQRRCQAIYPIDAPHPRMTLTRTALAGARHKILHIEGDEKLAVLEEALEHSQRIELMPIRAFLQDKIAVFWAP